MYMERQSHCFIHWLCPIILFELKHLLAEYQDFVQEYFERKPTITHRNKYKKKNGKKNIINIWLSQIF